MLKNTVTISFIIFILLVCLVTSIGIGLSLNNAKERQFVRCLENSNKNVLVLDYKVVKNGLRFSYAMKPNPTRDNAWTHLANCQNKFLDKETIYVDAVVFVPTYTIDDRKIHYASYIFFSAVFDEEDLNHAEDVDYLIENIELAGYTLGEKEFIPTGNIYHLSTFIDIMKKHDRR